MTMTLLVPPVGLTVLDLADTRDRARADAYVRAHRDATPFHLPAWSWGAQRGTGQRAQYLAATRGDGALLGVLPLTEVRSILFGRAMVSAGFAVGGGVLADDATVAAMLVDAAWRLAERRGCPTLELRGGPMPEEDWHHDTATYVGFTRPLAASDDAELAAIPRKQRAEVRKALAGDLAVRIGTAPAERAAHYAIYAESVRNLGTPVFPRRLFAAMLDGFGADADILTVSHKETAIASVLSLYLNGSVYPYWGGGTLAARTLRANERLYFALMGHARARGCSRFDFGRSKVGTGPAAFKKNWGFEPVPLAYAKRTRPGEMPREINPLSPKYRLQVAAWKKLPLWVANALGPPIARGLG